MAGSVDEGFALEQARAFPGLAGMDLAKEVTCDAQHEWTEGSWQLGEGHVTPAEQPWHVVAYDYGYKRNILRMLADRGCKVTVVPAKTPAKDVLAMKPDGVFLSNGPGDPEPCDYAIEAIREIVDTGLPVFGICLGHQLLAARTTGLPWMKIPCLTPCAPPMCRCLMDRCKASIAPTSRRSVSRDTPRRARGRTMRHPCSIISST